MLSRVVVHRLVQNRCALSAVCAERNLWRGDCRERLVWGGGSKAEGGIGGAPGREDLGVGNSVLRSCSPLPYCLHDVVPYCLVRLAVHDKPQKH